MRAILVPVKSFRQAKHRLSPVLDDSSRERLARRMASGVLAANSGENLFVVCDDGAVAEWATSAGAFVLWTPGLGLSGAVEAGVSYLAREGFSLAVVAHADLPKITALGSFGEDGAVTLAPDRTLDGTNVAAVPTIAGFRFAYGPRSFSIHRCEAARLGLPLRVIYDSRLAADVDVPADLVHVPVLVDEFDETRGLAEVAPCR